MRLKLWIAACVLAHGLITSVSFAERPAAKGAPTAAPKARATNDLSGSSTPRPNSAESPLSKLAVVKATLSNGLRVVLSPERTVPTVAMVVYYNVGSRNEQKGRSGFAHLFEHMMFQGSENVAKGEYFQLIMNRGGTFNGTTDPDRTNYFATLPSNELALGLWLEADRMRALNVNQENFENQRQTVMEERRQSYENRPYMLSMLRINEIAYGDYFPYAHSTIGDMGDLQRAPLEAVQEFFRTYYAPNNAVLSIAGDIDPNEALKLVKKYFGAIPRRNTPAFQAPDPAPQTKERVETTTDPNAELPAFHVTYRIPQSRTPDHYPLELLSLILGDGESSRLYQEMVKRKEIVQEIAVSTDDRRGPDLFSFWSILAKGHKPEEARKVLYQQIQLVAQKGVTERELEKAKNRVRAAVVFALESNLSRAMQLAEFELYWGDAELLKTELGKYLTVTAADVQRVAKQYLTETNRSVLDVLPGTAPGGGSPGASASQKPAKWFDPSSVKGHGGNQ